MSLGMSLRDDGGLVVPGRGRGRGALGQGHVGLRARTLLCFSCMVRAHVHFLLCTCVLSPFTMHVSHAKKREKEMEFGG